MTLWAFLSDIHANSSALDRALAQCRERDVERYAFLGDLLGRGDSEGVVSRVRSLADISIVGNRDIDWADRVSAESALYVRSLSRRAKADSFVVAHGDAKLDRNLNSDDLRRGGRKIFTALQAEGRTIFLFGHTHHARTWLKSSLNAEPDLQDQERVKLRTLSPGSVTIVNVGTVGKPFPGKGPASFVVLDDGPDGYVEHILVAAAAR
jgi:predicted phosphodiesterase